MCCNMALREKNGLGNLSLLIGMKKKQQKSTTWKNTGNYLLMILKLKERGLINLKLPMKLQNLYLII